MIYGAKEDGGPAFPGEMRIINHVDVEQLGMSLRDYFAGQALAICNRDVLAVDSICREHDIGPAELYARLAYEIADAMLKERAK